jgi:putative nucleotidyltransferase with HDIG domain
MRPLRLGIGAGFVRANPAAQKVVTHEPSGGSPPIGKLLLSLVATVTLAGLAISARGVLTAPSTTDWVLLAVLAVLAVLAERTDFSMYGSSRVSLAFVPIFAAIISCGYTGLTVVVPLAVAASAWGRPVHKTLFNFGTMMIAGGAAIVVLDSFPAMDYGRDWPQVIPPTALAGTANFLVNSFLVAVAISLSGSARFRDVWKDNFLWLLPHYVILAVIGVAMVAAYEAMDVWGLAVFIVPPLMMRLSIKQYVDHTTKNVVELRRAHGQLQQAHEQLTTAMTSLGKAYDGTLRSLVGALDARDSETAGHSERVADLTMAIAGEMGIPRDSEHWRYISWGALLHDVGKIAIPDVILRKPDRLTEDEWETMRTHPRAGFDILQAVEFLAPAAEMVFSHHERYDGRGYPRGLAGEQIPLGARIFMIADAFDAMTSDRVYRRAMPAEEALAEILRNSGSQFDPTAVRAFLSVYQKRFVGTIRHRHFAGPSLVRGARLELSESLKKAIAEAAGLDDLN